MTPIAESQNFPPVSAEFAAALLREQYGLVATAHALPGEYDSNFRVDAADGRKFVLKVMHPSRERAFVEMQCEALQHLAARAPHLALSRVQPARSGESHVQVTRSDGARSIAWLLSYLPGKILAEVRPHSPELLQSLGALLGELDRALLGWSHPATTRAFKWDSAQAAWIGEYLDCIEDAAQRALVARVYESFQAKVAPLLPQLRKSVIYGDANDYNVLVNSGASPAEAVISVIDFGDMHHGLLASEPAIAAAYALLGKADPLAAAAAIVGGFHRTLPLEETEVALLFPLIAMRLAVSVVNSARRKLLVPGDPYVTVSEAPAWAALQRLDSIHPSYAECVFRAACGLPASARGERLRRWLEQNGHAAAGVVDVDLRRDPVCVIDLGIGSAFLGADPSHAETAVLTKAIQLHVREQGAAVGIGRYAEARALYASDLFRSSANPTDEGRTLHLGVDLFLDAGAAIRAPFDGVVHLVADNAQPLDYGPLVILRHFPDTDDEFFTLYGHLSRSSVAQLTQGQVIRRGEALATLGTEEENGGWPPHLHLQIIADLLELGRDFPGVARASQRAVWTSLSPDPNLLLGIPRESFPREAAYDETLAERRARLGGNLSLSYRKPLKIVRGWRQYLYDDTGRAYLDVYNNVPLIGHSHPRVVQAVHAQLGLLNTNTRYLHDNVLAYARRLTATMPEPLRVCYFVNSGSEANELAIRLARAYTGFHDMIVLEHAYHGHTNTLIDISPYKFDGPGGKGRKPWVHVAPIADDYRGLYRRGEPDLGARYAGYVREIVAQLTASGSGAAAYIAETMPSVGGQIVFPPGYLAEVYRHMRAAGGVCIADEVQTGFGRIGSHFWGFETQDVVPDIVVMGKPIGNAFPLAAVVTTPQIAAAFHNGMEFFSTFGGNPVSCAAGLAVLEVLAEDNLQANAQRVGSRLKSLLEGLMARHPVIGDVRGSGLFLGLDLVRDRETREPAEKQASYVANRLRECGVLTGTDGPHHNVIKLRPPLLFTDRDADLFVSTLDAVLAEDYAQPGC